MPNKSKEVQIKITGSLNLKKVFFLFLLKKEFSLKPVGHMFMMDRPSYIHMFCSILI